MLRTAGFVVVLVFVALTAAPAGSPVQLSYVYSGSMVPTIGVDDGYLIVPAGHVEPGEVVTFWAPKRRAYTTHRLVGRTEGGFLSKGDHNPSTDQSSGFTPVTRDEIVGRVFTLNGSPVVIPYLGRVVQATRANILLVATGLSAAAVLHSRVHRSLARRRKVQSVSSVLRPVFGVSFVAMTGVLAFTGTTHDTTYVALDSAAVQGVPTVVPAGGTKPTALSIAFPETPFVDRVVATRGIDVTATTVNDTAVSLRGVVHAPPVPGPFHVSVTVNQYPAVLPHDALVALQSVHPIVASAACAFVVLAPIWALTRVVVDGRSLVRDRPSRQFARVRRWFS